ncbi:MAG: virulence-associated E family protein, partial [Ruthenibacterium sp.]
RQSEAVKREVAKQEDPLAKTGVVGAFCRAYSVESAIETFLADVYAPSAMDGRYDYIPADSSAGVVIYDDKFAYSHHATDPACGKLLNAFDLVRIHKFGDDDKKSFGQMCEMALSDDSVKLQIAEERQVQACEDFDSETDEWKKLLRYQTRSTVLENSVWNEMLILNNDPDYANFSFNEMANRVQITGPLPWERPQDNKFWRDADTAQMKARIDIHYVPFSSRNHEVSFTKVADDRSFHPIRDYLKGLPEWDGKKRVENLLIRYLQADNTDYVKTVTRKTFAAAVARIYHPGVKYDCVLVLDGIQGIGKSTLFKDLVGDEYYSETLSLTDMNDKSGAEKLQGFWIMEIAELAGMKKADIEKVKAFLSTSDDKYRPSYGKTVESHPRQCIIIASVNGERGYLRDITGNRRFWVVKLKQTEQKKTWHFTKEERDQIWAEAKYYYENGEKLYLEAEMIKEAEEVQREAMEVDERQGMVEEYLETLLPENWEEMDIYARKNYLSEIDAPTSARGTVQRILVSNAEIWCECFGHSLADLKPSDSYAIAALMTQIDGWERTSKVRKRSPYGKQRLYERTCCHAENTDK